MPVLFTGRNPQDVPGYAGDAAGFFYRAVHRYIGSPTTRDSAIGSPTTRDSAIGSPITRDSAIGSPTTRDSAIGSQVVRRKQKFVSYDSRM